MVLGAFIASEAYAKKQRNEVAKAEALRNAPQPVYYDKGNKAEVSSKQYNDITNIKMKPKNVSENEWNNAISSQFKQIGTYDPKKVKTNYKPDAMLKDMGVYTRKEPIARPDDTQYIYRPTGQTFLSFSSLKTTHPKAKPNDIGTQKVTFNKNNEVGYAAPVFGTTETSSVDAGSAYLDKNLELVSSKKNAMFLAKKKMVNGRAVYTVDKELTEESKTTKVVEGAYLLDKKIGTKADFVQSGLLTEDNIPFDGTKIGSFDNVYDENGNLQSSKDNMFNTDLLTEIGALKKDKVDPTYTYSARLEVPNSARRNKDGLPDLVTIKIPNGQDYKSYVAEKYPNYPVQEFIQANKNGEKTYLDTNGVKKTSGKKGNIAKSLEIPIISLVNGGSNKSEDDPLGKLPIELRFESNKEETAGRRRGNLTKANSFVLNNSELLLKSPNKMKMLMMKIQPLIVSEYNNKGDVAAAQSGVYRPIGTFLNQYGGLAQLKITLPELNMDMSFGQYMTKILNESNTQAFQKKIMDTKALAPAGSKVISSYNVQFPASQSVASAIGAEEGEMLRRPLAYHYVAKYTKVIDAVQNLAEGLGTEEKDNYTNAIFDLTTYKPSMDGQDPVPADIQKELDVLNEILKVQQPISKGGVITTQNGVGLLVQALDPDQDAKNLKMQTSSRIGKIANILNQYYESEGGNFTKLMAVINAVTPASVDGLRAIKVQYGAEQNTKLLTDQVSASRGISVAGRNARIEAMALRRTYFGPDGVMYAEGSGLAQFYLDVNGALYVGEQIYNKAIGFAKDKLNIDIGGGLLSQDDAQFRQKLQSGALAKVNAFKRLVNTSSGQALPDAFKEKEALAKKNNDDKLAKILEQMNNPTGKDEAEKEKYKQFAQRNFHKYMLAYQLAAAIQGGTGGRTISDQDVENILNSFNFGLLGKPSHEVAAIDASIKMLDRLISYNDAIANSSANGKGAYVAIASDRLLQRSNGGVGLSNMTSTLIASKINEVSSPIATGEVSNAVASAAATTSKDISGTSFSLKAPADVNYRKYKSITNGKGETPMSFEDFKKELSGVRN